jgi:serine/threonine protein kinase
MTEESRLHELVARWEAARNSGNPIKPEELCAECPEMLSALRSALIRLHRTSDVENGSLPGGVSTRAFEPTATPIDPLAVHCYRVGEEVAGFRLLGQIGEGGFGQVFEAEDPALKRPVAIKFLLPRAHARPGIQELFLSEARSMACIQHDHVVPIFQVGQVDSNLFLVMPLLVGETLAQRLKREGSLPPAEVRRIGQELCLGLAALHAKGLIHRDIKPANLWLEMTTGRVKVLDLGLADDAANLRVGSSGGTPAYMSPEQVDGRDLDFRSDLFSVGAVLYECATGRRAFPGQKLTEVLEAVRRSQPVPVREVNPGTPPELADLINRLLHKERTARPASALEVSEVLQSNASPAITTLPTPSRPHRMRLVGLAALLTLFVLVAVLAVLFKPPAEPKIPLSVGTTTEPSPLAPLAIESLQVIPWKIDADRLKEALPPLGARDHVLPTTADAIEVAAKLSRKAYSYIVLYRSDGQDVLLFPQDDSEIPALTDEPRYPSTRPDVRYVLDDGPGIWAVALLASNTPLPNYRDWRQQHPNQPWKPQVDPSRLSLALLDTGRDWRTLGNNRSFSRGERQFQLEPYQQQMDWLKRQVDDGAVMGVAFPVR